jgi:ABC-type Co2+ transport system permease subunit
VEQVTRKKWKEIDLKYRIALIVQMLTSVAVIVLAALQLSGKWEGANNLAIPLLGVMLIINGWIQYYLYNMYKNIYNKVVAFLCYGVGTIILIVTAIALFFR